jgi:hypothetical protein
MTSSQHELSIAQHNQPDLHGGIVAQVGDANDRIQRLMENRIKVLDSLLHDWKNDLLRIWIPLIAGHPC